MGRIVAAIAALMVLAGCGSETPPAAPSSEASTSAPTVRKVAASPEQIQQWTDRGTRTADLLQEAMHDMGDAAQIRDVDAMRAACTRVGDAGRELAAALPAPEADVTVLMQDAVQDIAGAEAKCQAFGPAMAGSDGDAFIADVDRAMEHVLSAMKVFG